MAGTSAGAEHVGRGRERNKLGNIVIPRSIEVFSKPELRVIVSAGAVPAAGPAVGTVVAPAGAVPAAGPAVGTVIAPATAPAVGTVVSPAAGPPVPTTVAPSPYNSSYPPTVGGVVQGHATPPPPYGAASTGAVVQAEVVAAAPMDRK